MNLFQSVKSFINSREVNSTFTTKELHDAMRGIESITPWKSYGNEFYRTDTYRSYLRRLGFVNRIKNSLWEVIAPIPSWFDSGTANFLLFPAYRFENGKTIRQSEYKGETRAQIELKLENHFTENHFKHYKNMKQELEFKVGDKVKIVGKTGYHGFEMQEIVEVVFVDDETLECEGTGGGKNTFQQTINKIDVVLYDKVTYKKGDLVEIIGNSNYHNFKMGSIIRLVELASTSEQLNMWKCEYLDGHDYWYVLEYEFKPEQLKTDVSKEKQDVNIPEPEKEVRPSSPKELARELVGDSKTPNVWFVTYSAYIMVREDFYTSDFELLNGYSKKDSETFGPFYSYQEACDKYDDIDLDPDCGIGQAFIEDRLIGTVKEKYLEKVIKVDYSFNEHDESKFYKK